jgi:hypothetical protein
MIKPVMPDSGAVQVDSHSGWNQEIEESYCIIDFGGLEQGRSARTSTQIRDIHQ